MHDAAADPAPSSWHAPRFALDGQCRQVPIGIAGTQSRSGNTTAFKERFA